MPIIRTSTLTLATLLAVSSMFGATPFKPSPDLILIKRSEIGQAYVHRSSTGGVVGFFFATKSKGEVDEIKRAYGERPLQFSDGERRTLGAKISAEIAKGLLPSERKYGFEMKFESVQEANRVAKEIMPFVD